MTWSSAGIEELANYPVVWKTTFGTIQKDHFEVNSEEAVIRVVIVPGWITCCKYFRNWQPTSFSII
jgi:hypothetical protein